MARYRPVLRGIFVWLLLVVATPVFAQGEPNFDRYFEAADRLDRLASEALQRGGPPPQLSDPQVAALFPDISQAGRVFDRSAYGPEALSKLLDVTRRAMGLMLLYVEWGSGPSDSASARARADNRNMVLHQAEIQGLSQMVTGIIDMMRYPGMTPESQLALANALAANGPAFAAALTVSQRRAIAMAIRMARERSTGPQTRAALSRALEAFGVAGCEGLCAI